MAETIYALSSGPLPAGIAIIRISGPKTRFVIETIAGSVPEPRRAIYRAFRNGSEIIDRGLLLYFQAPESFTGEDLAEMQVHGSRAVVAALLQALSAFEGLRPAEAGEFTRRAFENGRMDLTAVEGLADLIASETEQQRRQALRLADGYFGRRAEEWRGRIVEARAAIEADLDFSDEEDVPGSVSDSAFDLTRPLVNEIGSVLADDGRGERIREGFQVALMGPPNAGKSSLLNALAGRDVAIVTAIPGTTRDIVSVPFNLNGYAVILTDTAGLRETEDAIEQEGIRRAKAAGHKADLILWLDEEGRPPPLDLINQPVPVVSVRSKADDIDVRDSNGFPAALSARTGKGIQQLLDALSGEVEKLGSGENSLVTRERQRLALKDAHAALQAVDRRLPLEVNAEHLRDAGDALGRLTGRIDVEELLGSIFSTFCIGK